MRLLRRLFKPQQIPPVLTVPSAPLARTSIEPFESLVKHCRTAIDLWWAQPTNEFPMPPSDEQKKAVTTAASELVFLADLVGVKVEIRIQ